MLTWRIFFCSMTSFMTLNYGLSALKPEESFGNLSSPGLLNFGKFDNVPWYWYEIPIFILMGIFGGLLGAAFVQMNKCITGKLSNDILKAWLWAWLDVSVHNVVLRMYCSGLIIINSIISKQCLKVIHSKSQSFFKESSFESRRDCFIFWLSEN